MLTALRSKQSTPTASLNENEGTVVTLEDLIRLRKVAETLTLSSRQTVHTPLCGAQPSGLRGRGIDFDSVRIYQAGDDIRHIDWRVTARTGKTHTKVFCEDRERPIYIVVDYSPSMFFGTRVAFKSVIAAKIASILAWTSYKQQDRLGGMIFCGHQHQEFRPRRGTQGVLPFLHALAQRDAPPIKKAKMGALSNTLARLRRVTKPGSLIFIISDFADLDPESERLLTQLKQHNDLIHFFIYDTLEKEPPPPNYYAVSNGDATLMLETFSKKNCQNYRDHFNQHWQGLSTTCRKRAIPLLPFATHENVSKKMQQLFGHASTQPLHHYQDAYV